MPGFPRLSLAVLLLLISSWTTGPAAAAASPHAGDRIVVAAAATPLAATRWRLVALPGGRLGETPREHQPHLVFSSGGQVSGSTGCNRLNGSYRADGASLSFGPLAATRMACKDAMQTEQRFLQALEAVAGWRIDEDRLELVDAAGSTLATLEAD